LQSEIVDELIRLMSSVRRIVSILMSQDNSTKTSSNLVQDIKSEILKPVSEVKDINNPFNQPKAKKHRWTDSEVKQIMYCADPKTAMSKRQFSYLLRTLPNSLTATAVKNKVYDLGLAVKKGVVCSRTE
jgi:hypothetical protein